MSGSQTGPRGTVNEVLEHLKTQGIWSADLSPFGQENGYGDFQGLPLFEVRKLLKCKFERIDFSKANFAGLWIEDCRFSDVIFDSSNLDQIRDHGNTYIGCSFRKTSMRGAGLGFRGSAFINCVFENANFAKAVVNRPEFNECRFIDCRFKNIDFNAASFEDCSFVGKLDGVWFKGGFQTPTEEAKYGKPRHNRLKNTDFSKASFWGVAFSNHCGMDGIAIPDDGEHVLIANWSEALARLANDISGWPPEERKGAEVFVRVHQVHALTQESYVLNRVDIQKRYGERVSAGVLKSLEPFRRPVK